MHLNAFRTPEFTECLICSFASNLVMENHRKPTSHSSDPARHATPCRAVPCHAMPCMQGLLRALHLVHLSPCWYIRSTLGLLLLTDRVTIPPLPRYDRQTSTYGALTKTFNNNNSIPTCRWSLIQVRPGSILYRFIAPQTRMFCRLYNQ